MGPWFEGVHALQDNQLGAVDVKEAKSKNIAIVGAGMAGLMSYLVLTQAGMTNVTIIEAGQRLGGRVHTEYLSGGPFDYSYQEMGPMRFPVTYKDTKTNKVYNITDHQLVFQLAAELNKLNNNNKNFSIDFIPWIQADNNGFIYQNGHKLPSGLPPTLAQIASNPDLGSPMTYDKDTADLKAKLNSYLPDSDFAVHMANNMFKAHDEWIKSGLKGQGGDHWSEFGFMVNFLKGSLNSTDALNGSPTAPFWGALYDGMYFSAAQYTTVDGGLNRIPLAFHPIVDNSTIMDRKIERVNFLPKSNQVQLQWRDSFRNQKFESASYDYTLVAVPFSVIRKWRLPKLPFGISQAIKNLNYGSACKVALEFSERFWEHYENPIHGSCSTVTDIPGIGNVCYPSYNLNGKGPATMLGSYVSGDFGDRWAATPEEEHVQYVLDAMVEIHGENIRSLYTGKYNRRCWVLDPLESGAWADPAAGQHELYIPEYFKTYNNTIFIGEHTSYTHAWIASALESAIRGSVQLLLQLGLVDEAKAVVDKWMVRWIDI